MTGLDVAWLVREGHAKFAHSRITPILARDLGHAIEIQLASPNRAQNAALIVWLLNHTEGALNALGRVMTLAERWESAVELTGQPSIVARAFAAEMRAALEGTR